MANNKRQNVTQTPLQNHFDIKRKRYMTQSVTSLPLSNAYKHYIPSLHSFLTSKNDEKKIILQRVIMFPHRADIPIISIVASSRTMDWIIFYCAPCSCTRGTPGRLAVWGLPSCIFSMSRFYPVFSRLDTYIYLLRNKQ